MAEPLPLDWPPELPTLKTDMGIDATDTRDDDRLQQCLDAAVVFVERKRPRFNYADDGLSDYPTPTADIVLGTLRMAGRWHVRRRSPDMLIQAAEGGSGRVPAFDPDIERLLRIGRHALPAVG